MMELMTLWTHTTVAIMLGFFVLPGLLALAAEYWMCRRRTHLAFRLWPELLAVVLAALVVLNAQTGLLGSLIGGFVGALLLGTCLCLVLGSGLGFLAAWLRNRKSA